MKPTTNQLAQIIIETSEEITKTSKDIQAQATTLKNTSYEIEKASNKVKSEINERIESLKNTPISLDNSRLEYLNNQIKKSVEKGINELKNEKKQIPYIGYSIGILIISAILFFFAFKYGYTTKQELRTELEKDSVILDKTEYAKLRKFSEVLAKEYKQFENIYESENSK